MLDLIDRLAFAAATPMIWLVLGATGLALATHFVFPIAWLEIGAGLAFLAFMYHFAYMALRRSGLTVAALYAGRWPGWIERTLRALGGLVLFLYFLGFVAHADRAAGVIRRDPIAALDFGAEVLLLTLPPTTLAMLAVLVVHLVQRRRTR